MTNSYLLVTPAIPSNLTEIIKPHGILHTCSPPCLTENYLPVDFQGP